jgi:serine/threonine protein kinase
MGIAIHRGDSNSFYDHLAPVQYAAPEILNQEKFGYKVDIYSFGLFANYLFTELAHEGNAKHGIKFL